MKLATTEGTAPFPVPGIATPCQTWYQTVGDIHDPSSVPLILLHGGPGACHDYLLPLTALARTGIPVVLYDQLGNGRSTHLRDKVGDEAFWSIELFRAELDNLIQHLGLAGRKVDVYGHSWGGILAVEWAAKSPVAKTTLRRMVLASTLASMELFMEGVAELRARLPEDVRRVLDEAERTGDFTSPEAEKAIEVYYKRHLSLKRPWPCKEVERTLEWFAEDPTTYQTLYGDNELVCTGSLRDWTSIPILPGITVPTLLINGSEDESQDVGMQPFFDHLPKVKWITVDNAAHFAHVDQKEKYLKALENFLV